MEALDEYIKKSKEEMNLVSLVVTGNDTIIPVHIARAIYSIHCQGPGTLVGIRVNGITFRREISFHTNATLVPNVGISVDGRIVKKLKSGDEWYIDRIEAKVTIYKYDYDMAKKEVQGEMTLY